MAELEEDKLLLHYCYCKVRSAHAHLGAGSVSCDKVPLFSSWPWGGRGGGRKIYATFMKGNLCPAFRQIRAGN